MAKKPRPPEEEAEAGERWLVSYADMMTLLVALFIVLFAMADVSSKKFDALKESFNGHPQLAEAILQGTDSVIEGGEINRLEDSSQDNTVEFDTPVSLAAEGTTQIANVGQLQQTVQAQQAKDAQEAQAKADEKATFDNIKQEIEDSLAASGQQGTVKFDVTSRGLEITVITDQVLFDSGAARLKANSDTILHALGQPLSKVANDISVEGYTDNTPIATTLYPSNWELSTARATSVARYLTEREGVNSSKVGATGYGEFRPAVPNDSPEHMAQNRRVEIVVLSSITNK